MGDDIQTNKQHVDPARNTRTGIEPIENNKRFQWEEKPSGRGYVDSEGFSTEPMPSAEKTEKEKSAIHSGVGDHNDLYLKKEDNEEVTQDFQYATRYVGKEEHETTIYPEIEFDYGVHYEGEIFQDQASSPFEHRVDAYPKKNMVFDLNHDTLLPSQKPWKAVMNIESKIPIFPFYYAVSWQGLVEMTNEGDVKDLFTDNTGTAVGGGTGEWVIEGNDVVDYSNRGMMSGIINQKYVNQTHYEVETALTPTLHRGSSQGAYWDGSKYVRVQGWDDDVVGVIFKAENRRNFYVMMVESSVRSGLADNTRAPNNLENLHIEDTTRTNWWGTEYNEFVSRAIKEGAYPSENMTTTKWNTHNRTTGWGLQHRRVYRCVDGRLFRIDTPPSGEGRGRRTWNETRMNGNIRDLGGGNGWTMNQRMEFKLISRGRNIQIYIKNHNQSNFTKIFDFETHTERGSFGLMNWSQAVRFHNVNFSEWEPISGRIPENGFNEYTSPGNQTLAQTGRAYVDNDARQKANAASSVTNPRYQINTLSTIAENPENGSITGTVSTPIIVSSDNQPNAGEEYSQEISIQGVANLKPHHNSESTARRVFSGELLFQQRLADFKDDHPNHEIQRKTISIKTPDSSDSDWSFRNGVFRLWESNPQRVYETERVEVNVYAYEGWSQDIKMKELFENANDWSKFLAFPVEETFELEYDEHRFINEGPDTIFQVRTTEYYIGTYPADIEKNGVVTTHENKVREIPNMPEHFRHPSTNQVMFHGHKDVDFLLYHISPGATPEILVRMYFKSNPNIDSQSRNLPLNAIDGWPIIKTNQINDQVIIAIRNNESYQKWISGKEIRKGKVNGQKPFFSGARGKADMINVDMDIVHIPDYVINVEGPYVSISDDRVRHQITHGGKRARFYSNFEDQYKYEIDWYSKWTKDHTMRKASSNQPLTITNPAIQSMNELRNSSDWNSHVRVDGLEAKANHPFVKMWVSQTNPYHLQAQVKEKAPKKWHPLLHNGFYYEKENEYFLYSRKKIERLTVENNQVKLSSLPEQQAPVLVEDQDGQDYQKIESWTEEGMSSLEIKETMSGKERRFYYLTYGNVDSNTINVELNNHQIQDFLFNEDQSRIEFMRSIRPDEKMTITYKVKNSFCIDHKEEGSWILLHGEHPPSEVFVTYEESKETPFYKENNVAMNNIYQHHQKGFVYLSTDEKQEKKKIALTPSSTMVQKGKSVVFFASLTDQYDTGIEQETVRLWRENTVIATGTTGKDGTVTFKRTVDQPGVYSVRSGDVREDVFIGIYENKEEERISLDWKVNKVRFIKGETVTLTATVRDHNWRPVDRYSVFYEVEGNNTYVSGEGSTDDKGQLTIQFTAQARDDIRAYAYFEEGDRTKGKALTIRIR